MFPSALFDAARSLAAIEYKGNEIVRKLSDRAVIGDMPRSAAIDIINEGIAEGRKQPLRYATNQENLHNATASLGLAELKTCLGRLLARSRKPVVLRKSWRHSKARHCAYMPRGGRRS